MPDNETEQGLWRKVVSIEFLSVLFLIGVSWGTLTMKVSGLESQVAEQKVTQSKDIGDAKKITDDLSKEVNQINRKVDVLGANQDNFKQQIEKIDTRLERIQDLLEDGAHR